MARKSQRLRRLRRIERMRTREQEAKMTKVVEDNSIMLEKMKSVSSSCDKILQSIDTTVKAQPETEPVNLSVVEPEYRSVEPVPQLEEPPSTAELSKMLKRELLKMAEDRGCDVKATMTKANIIKAIQAA